MLNTNVSNIEPREKELLLERRHSICLEVSKKRRQSAATSIFIPKDYLKTTSKTSGNPKPNLKNKRILTSIINKKRNFARFLIKKKLKRLTMPNKNKGLVNHPESYPIVRQSISSERIRCIVGSLRDESMAQNSTNINKPTSAVHQPRTYMIEWEKTQVEDRQVEQENKVKSLEAKSHESTKYNQYQENQGLSKTNENQHIGTICTNLKIEPPALSPQRETSSPTLEHKNKLMPQKQYSSINKVDNFVIMADSSGSNVEIKYGGNCIPSSYENLTTQNFSENVENSYSSFFEKIKQEHMKIDYSKGNNYVKAVNQNNVISQPSTPAKSTEEYTKIGDDPLKLNLTKSNQNIMDLKLKVTPRSPHMFSAENQYAKLTYPIFQTTPPSSTVNRKPCHPLPAQQRNIACHGNIIFNNESPCSVLPTCCHYHNQIMHSNLIAHSNRKQCNADNRPYQLQHNYSLNHPRAYHEIPPVSLSDQKHYLPGSTRINLPHLDLQQNLENHTTNKTHPMYINSLTNLISTGLDCSPFTNAVYPFNSHTNEPSYIPDDARYLQPIPTQTFSSHHFKQLSHSHQTNVLPVPQKQCNYRQPIQINHDYQPRQTSHYNHLDLPTQFYHPLHQSFFTYPNRGLSAIPAQAKSMNESEIFETWNLNSNPNTKHPHLYLRAKQHFQPLTPPTCDYNWPTDHLIPKNYPFSSPSWTNTLNNCSSLPIKGQYHLNMPRQTNSSMHPKLNFETEYISDLHTTAPMFNTNMIKNNMHNTVWPPNYKKTNTSSSFSTNYI